MATISFSLRPNVRGRRIDPAVSEGLSRELHQESKGEGERGANTSLYYAFFGWKSEMMAGCDAVQ
jgi:hypothetical protein